MLALIPREPFFCTDMTVTNLHVVKNDHNVLKGDFYGTVLDDHHWVAPVKPLAAWRKGFKWFESRLEMSLAKLRKWTGISAKEIVFHCHSCNDPACMVLSENYFHDISKIIHTFAKPLELQYNMGSFQVRNDNQWHCRRFPKRKMSI